jgi:hypothetical protein
MPWPTLDEIKAQCRLDLSYDAEDALLTSYLSAARDHIQQHLNRTLFDTTDQIILDPSTGLALVSSDLALDTSPGDSIALACKLLVAHWFVNRESTSTLTIKMVPLAFDSLLSPYRVSPR